MSVKLQIEQHVREIYGQKKILSNLAQTDFGSWGVYFT